MQRLSWLLAFWLCSSTVLAALPPLQGTAVYQRLGTDMFRASVYSDESEWKGWSQPQAQLVLETRVVSDSMSARRFYRIWNEALAINLDDSQLREAAEPIGRFLRCVRGTLEPGDKILISNLDGHSRVSINDIEVLDWPDASLVPLLAHAWVGRFPYSPAFQRQLLGLKPAERVEAMVAVEAIQPREGRQDVIESWIAPVSLAAVKPVAKRAAVPVSSKPPAQTVAKEKSKLAVESAPKVASNKPTSVKAIPQPVATEVEVVAKPVANEPTVSVAAEEPSTANAKPVAAEPEPVVPAVSDQPQVASSERVADVVPSDGALAVTAPQPVDIAIVTPPAVKAVDQVDWATLQMVEVGYYRQLITQATRAVRYPQRALRRGQEGEVRILVRLDASGEVLAVETSSSSTIDALDRAARKAVEDAAPYPPAPSLLDEDMLEFELPFRFALTD